MRPSGRNPAKRRARDRAGTGEWRIFGDACITGGIQWAGFGAALEEIARLNPRASAPRIRLGLAAELRGDSNQAERWLQEAYSVDRQFETRWTLANFYFRQDRRDDFWTWMRSALEMSYGDRAAAFDLCWQASANSKDAAAEILDRAIPDRREVVASYLAYTLNHHKQAAIAGAALRLAKMRSPDDLPLLYSATDVVLDPDLWQALGNPRPAGIITRTSKSREWAPASATDSIGSLSNRQV